MSGNGRSSPCGHEHSSLWQATGFRPDGRRLRAHFFRIVSFHAVRCTGSFEKVTDLGAVRLDGRPLSDRVRHGDSIPVERCLPLRRSVRLPLCEREWMPVRQ